MRRLKLKGLDPCSEYEVTEPLPNTIGQQGGNMKIEDRREPWFQLGKPCKVICCYNIWCLLCGVFIQRILALHYKFG